MLMCVSLLGCGSSEVEKQELIRGDAPEYNDELIHVGMIQTGKESDWRDANTNDYLNTTTRYPNKYYYAQGLKVFLNMGVKF